MRLFVFKGEVLTENLSGVTSLIIVGEMDDLKGWSHTNTASPSLQMSVGQRAKLTCSPEFAYGSKGHPGIIPPNSTLVFDVELLGLE